MIRGIGGALSSHFWPGGWGFAPAPPPGGVPRPRLHRGASPLFPPHGLHQPGTAVVAEAAPILAQVATRNRADHSKPPSARRMPRQKSTWSEKLSMVRRLSGTRLPKNILVADRLLKAYYSSTSDVAWAGTVFCLFTIAQDAGISDYWTLLGDILGEVILLRLFSEAETPLLSSLIHPIATLAGQPYSLRAAFDGSYVHAVSKSADDPVCVAGWRLLAHVVVVTPATVAALLTISFLRHPGFAAYLVERICEVLPAGNPLSPGTLLETLGAYFLAHPFDKRFLEPRHFKDTGKSVRLNTDACAYRIDHIAGAVSYFVYLDPCIKAAATGWTILPEDLEAALRESFFSAGHNLMAPHVCGHFKAWGLLSQADHAFRRKGTNTRLFHQAFVGDLRASLRARWGLPHVTPAQREALDAVTDWDLDGMACKAVNIVQNFVHAGSLNNWRRAEVPALPPLTLPVDSASRRRLRDDLPVLFPKPKKARV